MLSIGYIVKSFRIDFRELRTQSLHRVYGGTRYIRPISARYMHQNEVNRYVEEGIGKPRPVPPELR